MKTAIENLAKRPEGDFIVNMAALKEKFPEKFEESGQMNWKWFESEVRPNHKCFFRPDKSSFTVQLAEGSEGPGMCEIDMLFLLRDIYKYSPMSSLGYMNRKYKRIEELLNECIQEFPGHVAP